MVSWYDEDAENGSGFRPRRCAACGSALEEWPRPLEVGAHVCCLWCGLVYLVTDSGLERVLLDEFPDEFRAVVEEVMAADWSDRLAASQ